MTATTDTPRIAGATTAPRLTAGGLLRSETVKLTSLRALRVTAIAVVAFAAGGAVLRAFAFVLLQDGPSAAAAPSVPAWQSVLDTAVGAAELPLIVFAVLAAGSEWTQRAVAAHLVAAPRRLAVLGAKTVAVLVPVFVLPLVGTLVGAAASLPLMSQAGIDAPGWDAALVGTLLAALLRATIIALVALALTVLFRSVAAGLLVTIALVYIVPVAVSALAVFGSIDLTVWQLSYAASMSTAAIVDPGAVAELPRNVAVTAAWVGVPAVAAATTFVRRDV